MNIWTSATHIDDVGVDVLHLAVVTLHVLVDVPLGLPHAVEADLEKILKDLIKVEAAFLISICQALRRQ